MRHYYSLAAYAVLGLLTGGVHIAHAQVIPDRAALDTLLGASAATEDFQTYSIANGSAEFLGTGVFDATTVANGQGPGLVLPGIRIASDLGRNLFSNGQGYFELPSRSIGADGDGITVTFLAPVTAFGIDLLAFLGFPDNVTAQVFDTGGNLINTTSGIVVSGVGSPVPPTFFGFANADGVGSVRFDGIYTFSPVIDNATFGIANVSQVPEPSTLALFVGAGIAALGLRRKSRVRTVV